MDLALLQELKQKLQHEKQFSNVWLFFMDHFAEDPQFIAVGERTRHAFVEAVVAQVGRQLFPKDGTVTGLVLVRVPETSFLHGAFSMGGRPGGVIYFEDLPLGLVAVPDLPPSIDMKYARFAGRPLHRPSEPSRN